jgi:cation diffusion facilitator family transporter
MLRDPAERAAIVSMATTTAVGVIELWAAVLFGSLAFIAAGIDALSDTATSVGVLAGRHVSKRPADRGHPYGHAQAETLISILLAAVLLFAGARVAYLAIEKIHLGLAIEATLELFLLAGLALVIFGVLARYKIHTGRRVHSLSLVADGYHTLTDAASAAAIIAGLGLVGLGHTWADPVVALAISALILRWGFGVGHNALNILMEASPSAEVLAEINRVCVGVPGVLGCHRCRARRVGPRIFTDVHIYVDPKMSVARAHKVATRVEHDLKTRIADLTSVVVHIEPARRQAHGKKR